MASSLSFSLRTTSSVKTVHLIGSWDGYQGQLPLAKESSKKGSWKGTFRFSSKNMQAGQRYWYYYQMDGYSVSHDPSKEFTVEPTTGRKLNILDVPEEKTSSSKSSSHKTSSSSRRDRRSREIPQGRALPAAEIKCPRPCRPTETQHIVKQEYTQATLDELAARFSQANISYDDDDDEESEFEEDSDDDSDCSFGSIPSLTSSGSSRSSRSSNCSSPSSVSSASSSCTCDRFGVTRSGQRIKMDCGGERCGSADECEDEGEKEYMQYRATRRHGVVIR
jgi:hypothetical protein